MLVKSFPYITKPFCYHYTKFRYNIKMIDNQSIEALKNSIDIVDVIGNFIELKKAGANYKAPCPFHGEKTPSFVVSPSKQIYHCFGCGAGGDAIKFLMDYEKLNYPEAIEKLASMFNFSLQYTKGTNQYADAKRVLEHIQIWYSKNLETNTTAKEYLHARGISQNSIEKFGIGYVGENQSVMNFLNSSLLPQPAALQAGIISQNEQGKYYARLTHRITFPIYQNNGSIVGFGGRTMNNHPAKYINSPQTKLFNKSRLLYGYHQAKDSIYKQKQVIVCEGYFDVIMLHQANFTQAVATLGTALTKEHLPLLKKGEPSILLAYDGDKAGIQAAIKASKLLSQEGFDGGVVLFPEGLDPADMVANDKISQLAELFRNPKPFIPFILESIVSSYDISNPKAKELAFAEIKELFSNLSEILKESYIPLASSLLGISPKLFGTQAILKNQFPSKHQQNKDDIAYLSILKTLIENPSLIQNVIEVLESSIFGTYQDIFQAIINNDMKHPQVLRLSVDETIKTLQENELHSMLCSILIRYYETKLKLIISNQNISYDKKSYWIRKIRTDIIPRLKKNELLFVSVDI